MTREDEIKEARHEWYLRTQDADFCAGFQKGAEWADEHPINYDGKAMLYVNQKSHDNGYKEAIDKAVEWLEKNVADIWNSPCNPDKIIEDFRKAMIGE